MELEEACRLRRELVENRDNAHILTVLERLGDATVTKDILERSKLGIELNKLRKAYSSEHDSEVCKLATSILLQWRDVMLGKSRSASTADGKVFSGPTLNTSATSFVKRPSPEPQVGEKSRNEEEKDRKRDGNEKGKAPDDKKTKFLVTKPSENFSQSYLVGDAVRDKCFQMLVAALTVDATPAEEPDELILSTSRTIEECLYQEFNGQVTPAYKAKFRSKYLNLREKSNSSLRKAVLSGIISAERFCAMNAAEMASEERRAEDRRLIEQNLREAKAAQDTEAETDQFRCGRCGQRKTKYYQLQTRSADEPMTTFVTCINCGNRWKFC